MPLLVKAAHNDFMIQGTKIHPNLLQRPYFKYLASLLLINILCSYKRFGKNVKSSPIGTHRVSSFSQLYWPFNYKITYLFRAVKEDPWTQFLSQEFRTYSLPPFSSTFSHTARDNYPTSSWIFH